MIRRLFLLILSTFYSLGTISGQFTAEQVIVECNTCSPTSLSIGDVDGDQLDDVLTVSDSRRIGWFKNLGTNEFSKQKIIHDSLNEVRFALIDDINRDHKQDIVSITKQGRVDFFMGTGIGNFEHTHSFSTTLKNPIECTIADLDNDNYSELICNDQSGIVVVKIQDIDNIAETRLSNSKAIHAFEVIDIDNDNDQDVVGIQNSNNLVCFINNGEASLLLDILYASTMEVSSFIIKDIDGGRDKDIVMYSERNNRISLLKNILNDSPQKLKYVAGSQSYTNLPAHGLDVDNDGDIDLLSDYPHRAQGLSWLENKGTGEFLFDRGYPKTRIISPSSNTPLTFKNIDANGDEYMDIAYIDHNLHLTGLYLNNKDGSFTELFLSEGATRVQDLNYADLNGNSKMELISVSQGKHQIVRYSPSTQSTESVQNLISQSIYAGRKIIPADFDGDGDIDIASLAFSFKAGRICWYENINGDNFIQREIPSEIKGIQRMISGDLDNDGVNDLIYSTSYLKGTISWNQNNGKGNFSENRTILNREKVRVLHSSDFNNDGLNDILFSTSRPPIYGWLQNYPNREFYEHELVYLNGCKYVFCEDIDKDNDCDIICAKTNGNLSIFENVVGKSFDAEKVIANDTYISSLDVSDLDKDGDLDIVASNKNGVVYILENVNNDSYTISQIKDADSRNGIEKILVFDYDNDGDEDIIATVPRKDKLIWFENLIN